MRTRDLADDAAPFDLDTFRPPASLHDALDAFAPEHPASRAGREALRAADQFVRDGSAALTPARALSRVARAADVLRRNAGFAICVGAVAGLVAGAMSAAIFDAPGPEDVAPPPGPKLPTTAGDVVLLDAPEPLRMGMLYGSNDGFKFVRPPTPLPGARQLLQARAPSLFAGGRLLLLPVPTGLGASARLGSTNPALLSLAASPDVASPPDATVYSSTDVDVRPPQMHSAELPGPTIVGAPTRVAQMEVLVSEQGSVEHAKFLTQPRRMMEMMLLSRAKVWEFTPASKDGRPVRYRLVLSWETNP